MHRYQPVNPMEHEKSLDAVGDNLRESIEFHLPTSSSKSLSYREKVDNVLQHSLSCPGPMGLKHTIKVCLNFIIFLKIIS
uniref:Uncharacterized protein n=1 Tax=Arundo donax TaxID=35708 RepID=A0A0A9BBE1_ARUDO